MTPNASQPCPQCGTLIPEDSANGLCPPCVFAKALTPTANSFAGPHVPPTLESVRAAFAHLEVTELIGSGGMGSVFKARQPQLDRFVALKILPTELAGLAGFSERFQREAQALAKLSHPHIVTIHDFGHAGGFYFLLMEFVDGVNLRQAMKAGRFTPEQALAVVPPVCEALQFAHEHGIVHRDIKPENLLLDKDGRVKIADFGIAKMLGDDSSVGLTESQPVGTPQYMAPEQKEHQRTDHRADIYSLGVVLYEMLTGELPADQLQPPSRKVQIDVRLDEIVLRALEKTPELRHQTAGEMRTRVETFTQIPAAGSAVAQAFFASPESWEYKSARTLFGLPLLHVVSGSDPKTRRWRVARGVFAFGGVAHGVCAFGARATGVMAFGGVATGVIAMGGVAFGLVSFGGLALALLFSLGGIAMGFVATGGIALGFHAKGGLAIGRYAIGGRVFSEHVVHDLREMPTVLWFLNDVMPWLMLGYGLSFSLLTICSIFVPRWARGKVMSAHSGNLSPGATARC